MAEKMHLNSLIIFATVGCFILVTVTSTTTHIVGDHVGWNMPHYQGFFDDWAKNKTFVIGDVLLFRYNPGQNTVVQVDKDDYGNCTSRNTIHIYVRGNSSVTLEKAGDYFFFSSVGKHCEAGQKLWVTVPRGKPSSH